MLKLLARDACLISDGGVNHSSVQNGSCPQFPYWEIELETHVSNATCTSVKSPRSFLSSYFMLISCTFLRPITRNVKQTGWTEMLQEFRTSCVVGIRKRKCPRERTRVLLSRAYSRSSLCKQNNLHVNNLYTISALKYVTRLGKSKTKNVEKMYVLNLPKGVRKLFPRNLTLIIAMSKTLISLEISTKSYFAIQNSR